MIPASHTISFNVRGFVASAERIDTMTRDLVPQIPWETLDAASREFEEDPFDQQSVRVNRIALEIIPCAIPLLTAIIPREEEIQAL